MSTLAFDKYAANYDAHFSRTAIGLQQRKRVHRFLFPLLNKNQSVLEINCGTGEDALEISHRVKEVLATDISAGMVEQAALKTGEVHPNLQFKVCDLKNLPLELRDAKYDLLFSNFGGLNCIAPQELKLFAKNISSHVTAGGRLALVVMGRRCVW
jgi:ubiquinone/menaquinone biosynthesis C-methylase UbiE